MTANVGESYSALDRMGMPAGLRWVVAQQTDAGLLRAHNDDSLYADTATGLFMVADGMGGYKAGDVASELAIRILREEVQGWVARSADMEPADRTRVGLEVVHTALDRAHAHILQAAAGDSARRDMGTTVAMLLLLREGARALIAHVGDSRIYRLRAGQFQALTLDHTLLQEQVDRGIIDLADARVSNNRNLVTRALGMQGEPMPEVREIDVCPGDVYLLCTDGLNDMVDDADIGLAVRELSVNLPLAARLLVEMAKDNGGHDNISVMLVRVDEGKVEAGHALRRLFGWFRQRLPGLH